jgi:biotin transport system substrate-specific component
MNSTALRHPPLASVLWPASGQSRLLRALALVVLGSLLLTASAKIMVPFWPVQMSMQTFAVLIIGAAYGSRLAFATVAAYLAQGAAGLPVFGLGGGLAYFAGPTGGYLVGFLVAATLVGWLAERGFGRHVVTALVAFLAGDAVIFLFGVGWLAVLIGPGPAIAGGLVPFLPAEVLKIALAVALLPLAWRGLRGSQG